MSRFIGNVSAYAYAVSKGYTGTEEEFAELMADYAEVGQRAEDAAESALNSKTAAQTAATTATNKASEATTAAQTATTKAGEAQTSAQTASSKASEAVGCVETATQKATEATQSASQALTYKNDAESAKTASQTAQGLAESARDSAISAKNDAESARDDAQEIVDDISAKSSQIDANTAGIASLSKDKAPVITDTASGAIASFSDGADGIPLKSLVVDINPVQDLHGQDSPWPAGGGKNLFDIEKWFSDNNVDYTKTGNSYSLTLKSALYSSPFYFSDEDVTVSISVKSITDGTSTNARMNLVDKDGKTVQNSTINSGTFKRENLVAAGVRFDWNSAGTVTIEAPQIELGATATSYAPYENICPISGWTEVDVEQRGKNLLNPDISSWRLRGTAYRYINNVVPKGQTARLTFIDKDTSVSVSGISLGFVYNDLSSSLPSTYTWVLNNGALGRNVSNVAVIGNVGAKCQNVMIYPQSEEAFNAVFARYNVMVELGTTASDYEPYQGESIPISWQTEAGTVYGGKLDVLSGVMRVYPYYASYNGETLTGEWISDRDKYVSGTTPTIGAQVVNIGAQGVTVQLEPHEVESLYGINNIWADSGDTEVEYRADTKLYIAKKIAEAISALS